MSAKAGVQLSKLIRRDGPCCHYCNKLVNRRTGSRDHVVPRSLGGINHISNYVLACFECNQLRGIDLGWCDCDFCGPLIIAFKASDEYLLRQFKSLTRWHLPVVRYRAGRWRVYLMGNIHMFHTFEDAIEFATTYQPTKERVYVRQTDSDPRH